MTAEFEIYAMLPSLEIATITQELHNVVIPSLRISLEFFHDPDFVRNHMCPISRLSYPDLFDDNFLSMGLTGALAYIQVRWETSRSLQYLYHLGILIELLPQSS